MVVQVYDTLSEDNLLDLLTMSMQTYTTPHEWMVYGTGFNYMDHKYESVSRFLFDELEINQTKNVTDFLVFVQVLRDRIIRRHYNIIQIMFIG